MLLAGKLQKFKIILNEYKFKCTEESDNKFRKAIRNWCNISKDRSVFSYYKTYFHSNVNFHQLTCFPTPCINILTV